MKCCNAEVTTPFCPECGKLCNKNEPPLRALVRQCFKSAKMLTTLAESHRHMKREKHAASAERSVEKWQIWGEELQRLLDLTNCPKHIEGQSK